MAGSIDVIVRLLETVIQSLPTFKFQNSAGKEMPIRDLAGLARSVQAATSIRQGATIDTGAVRSLEGRLAAIETDTKNMLTQLAARETISG